MQHLEAEYGWLDSPQAYVSLKHEGDKVIVFERAGLLFVFNFHPTQSFTDYRVGVDVAGEYRIVLSSDDKLYGGFNNIDVNSRFITTPLEWNNRKNWLQVSGSSHIIVFLPSPLCDRFTVPPEQV
jgi:1,4-alpha-glucan branching enzyme